MVIVFAMWIQVQMGWIFTIVVFKGDEKLSWKSPQKGETHQLLQDKMS